MKTNYKDRIQKDRRKQMEDYLETERKKPHTTSNWTPGSSIDDYAIRLAAKAKIGVATYETKNDRKRRQMKHHLDIKKLRRPVKMEE